MCCLCVLLRVLLRVITEPTTMMNALELSLRRRHRRAMGAPYKRSVVVMVAGTIAQALIVLLLFGSCSAVKELPALTGPNML